MKQQTTKTMQECGVDQAAFEEILGVLNKIEKTQVEADTSVDLRGVGKFTKYPPDQFKQLAESEDGSLAVTYEVRDWEMTKGKKTKSGTSKKIHVRTKYINNKGEKVYGYDLASFNADKGLMSTVVSLLIKSLEVF